MQRDVRRQVRRQERAPAANDAFSGSGKTQSGRPRRAPRSHRAARGRAEHTTAVQLAGDLGAEHVRQLRHLRVEPAPDQHVGEVDPGGADVDDRRRRSGSATSSSDERCRRPRGGRRPSPSGPARLALLEERRHALAARPLSCQATRRPRRELLLGHFRRLPRLAQELPQLAQRVRRLTDARPPPTCSMPSSSVLDDELRQAPDLRLDLAGSGSPDISINLARPAAPDPHTALTLNAAAARWAADGYDNPESPNGVLAGERCAGRTRAPARDQPPRQ